MKKNNVLLMFLASGLFFVGINGMAAESKEEVKEEATEILVSDLKVLDASTRIEITIKNESSFEVRYTPVDELEDLFFISGENRWVSKTGQWFMALIRGETNSLQPTQDKKIWIDTTKMLAFYVIDTTRIQNNVKRAATVVSSASTACLATANGAPVIALTSLCTTKKSLGEMQKPGDRISCKEIATGSVIILFDSDTDDKQEQSNCGIIIKIISPETK